MSFDKKVIAEQMATVLQYTQDYCFKPNVDAIIDQWLDAKRDFIEVFGGEPIYEYPETVQFSLDKNQKAEMLETFINYVQDTHNDYLLGNFISLNKDTFFENKVSEIPPALNDIKELKVGMKIIKAFKFFVNDKELLTNYQNMASRLIQNDKISGKLCISVHPLDFLSASENNENWRSCHALNGEYRAGNISYLLDKCTTIMYLKSDDTPQDIWSFPKEVPWNSKKWRMWLYWSDNWDMLFAGRQYPFQINNMLDFIKDKFLPSTGFGTGSFTSWTNKQISRVPLNKDEIAYLNRPVIIARDSLEPISEVVIDDSKNPLHYNDLLRSTVYTPYYSFMSPHPYYFSDRNTPHFHVGSHYNCVKCNKEPVVFTESFLCKNCEFSYGNSDIEGIVNCDECGARFDESEGYWIERAEPWDDDIFLCPECARKLTKVCDNCGVVRLTNEMYYHERTGMWLCSYCFEDITVQEENEEEEYEGSDSEDEF